MRDIHIVELAPEASDVTRALFANIAPGSVAVATKCREGWAIYYEGGLYTRPAHRPPTPAERVDYAQLAASRAATSAPTVARFFLSESNWTDLQIIGHVRRGGRVTFYESQSTV